MLTRLIYRSRSLDAFGDLDLQDILDVSRRNNRAVGIGGALFYFRPHFVQILEGETDAVETTFKRIVLDWRHRSLTKVSCSKTGRRAFPGWGMLMISPDAAHEVLSKRGIGPGDTDTLPSTSGELLQLCFDAARLTLAEGSPPLASPDAQLAA